MTFSLRLNDEDGMLIRKYAELNGISVSDLIRQAVIGRIEDEYDLTAYEKAIVDYHINPVAYSLDEVEKDLGLQ